MTWWSPPAVEPAPISRRCGAWQSATARRFAVTRPQVEAGRASRAELVGASSETVAPAVYLGLGVGGSLAHLVGMDGSVQVIAVNTDRSAPIFDHADLGVVADAMEVVRALEAV